MLTLLPPAPSTIFVGSRAPCHRTCNSLPAAVACAYYGDFASHPGVSGRADWQLDDRPHHAVNLEAEVAAFWHPADAVAAFLRAGPAVRWTGGHGGTYGAFVHVGAEHAFWAVPAYVVADGQVKRAVLPGDSW